jgi:hypothetical protein
MSETLVGELGVGQSVDNILERGKLGVRNGKTIISQESSAYLEHEDEGPRQVVFPA